MKYDCYKYIFYFEKEMSNQIVGEHRYMYLNYILVEQIE